MSESNQIQDEWNEMVEQMNEAVADSVEQNMKAQAAFVESWTDAFENNVPEEDVIAEGLEGYKRAYEVWMDASEQFLERAGAAAEGEDVDPSELRDIWLQSANQAFKEVMSTSAFASANGQLVGQLLEMQEQVDEVTQDTISQMGLPTREDVEEVGARLIELERRQHDVEDKLDEIIDEEVGAHLSELEDRQHDVEDKLDEIIDEEVGAHLSELEGRHDDIEDKLDEIIDEEVGDRLSELEGRHDDVEDKLDEILDAIEE